MYAELYRTDFNDLTGWTNGGGVSISPAGWAYHPGNGTASGFIYRTMGAGETYCETRCYLDANNTDWLMMKMNSNTGAMYDSGAANGCGLAVRGDGVSCFSYWGGTTSGTWGGTFTVSPRPGSTGAAVVVGMERIAANIYDFYLNGVLLGRRTSTQSTTGTLFVLGGYNGVGAHFDYFAAGIRDPFVSGNAPSPMVMG